LKFINTRNPNDTATFREAVLRGMAPDGGLWMPETLPVFEDWDSLLQLRWVERSEIILRRFIGDEFDQDVLAAAISSALDFPIPLARVRRGLYALELFHGPTLAFKDVGARFFAHILDMVRKPGLPLTILTATSGDTGAAVAQAFWHQPGARVVVLYPKGRVSDLQERQFATLGDNVTALAVEGSFDDCQALVKECFNDADLSARHGLTSANSINVARLLPQMLYYAEAVAQLHKDDVRDGIVISVPSGNFGNLCAGLMARQTGLPIRAFVVATNANATVPRYLDSGEYLPQPTVATLSNAMDVGAPNNWERIQHLFGNDLYSLRQALRWSFKNDADTKRSIRELMGMGYLADPHAAVAYAVLEERLGLCETGVFLGTAHPAKFLPVYEPMGIPVPIPDSLAALRDRPLLSKEIPNDVVAVRQALDNP
jgi:threonine synthase